MHTNCKRVFVAVADLLRDIDRDEAIPEPMKDRCRAVGQLVAYNGFHIVDMEIAGIRDTYRESHNG